MTEPGGSIDAEALRARLPDGWRVERWGGGAVCGHASDDEAGADERGRARAFCIRPVGDHLWTAAWWEPGGPHSEHREQRERVTGIKERCVEWVAERARGLEWGAGGG